MSDLKEQIFKMVDGMNKVAAMPCVYPLYIAAQIKRAMVAKTVDPEKILRDIGEIETIGDCRYAITVTDFNGSRYRLTIEVLP